MPWKETVPVQEKMAFIVAACAEDDDRDMSELCRAFGISRNTGYETLERFRQAGLSGLEPRSRAPLFAARRHRPCEHGPPRILEGRLSMGYRTLSPAQQGTPAERKRVTHVPGLQCHPCPRLHRTSTPGPPRQTDRTARRGAEQDPINHEGFALG